MRSVSSSAALRPISGSEPAPRPRVMSFPSWSFIGARHLAERLQVGVDGDELDAAELGIDHAVDGVAAAAAHAHDLDLGGLNVLARGLTRRPEPEQCFRLRTGS